MELISSIAVQLILVCIGFLMAKVVGVKDQLEAFGVSFLLGSGVVSLLFLLFHWVFGLGLNATNFLLVVLSGLVSLLAALAYVYRGSLAALFEFSTIKQEFSHLLGLEKLVFSIIGLLVVYGVFENYFWPVTDWDALALYDFRARVVAGSGTMLEGIELGYFFQYPPYTSFLHVFGYVLGATRVKLAYSFIYFSLLLAFYALLRKNMSRLISGIATLLLASSPMIFQHSVMAYSNLPFTAFFSLGIIYLWHYCGEGNKKDLLLGGILIGLSTWIRSTEPFWLVALGLIVWGFIRHRSHALSSVLLAGWLSLPDRLWRAFLRYLDTLSPASIGDTESHTSTAIQDFFQQHQSVLAILVRMWDVSYYLFSTLAPDFFLLFLLLLISLLTRSKVRFLEITTMLMLLAIVFGGTLIFSFTFETWNVIGGSIVRMCMIFIPLLLFVAATNVSYEKK